MREGDSATQDWDDSWESEQGGNDVAHLPARYDQDCLVNGAVGQKSAAFEEQGVENCKAVSDDYWDDSLIDERVEDAPGLFAESFGSFVVEIDLVEQDDHKSIIQHGFAKHNWEKLWSFVKFNAGNGCLNICAAH